VRIRAEDNPEAPSGGHMKTVRPTNGPADPMGTFRTLTQATAPSVRHQLGDAVGFDIGSGAEAVTATPATGFRRTPPPRRSRPPHRDWPTIQ
jgi:hypothetical protein